MKSRKCSRTFTWGPYFFQCKDIDQLQTLFACVRHKVKLEGWKATRPSLSENTHGTVPWTGMLLSRLVRDVEAY